MFPDLGLYLVEQGQKDPFELAVFNHLMLGEDRVLGWRTLWRNSPMWSRMGCSSGISEKFQG